MILYYFDRQLYPTQFSCYVNVTCVSCKTLILTSTIYRWNRGTPLFCSYCCALAFLAAADSVDFPTEREHQQLIALGWNMYVGDS